MQSSTLKNDLVSRMRSSSTLTTILFSLLVIYFLVKTLYFALNIGVNISPDEITWVGRSLVFSKFFFLPIDSPATYEYGLLAHSPYLYTWLMGKLLHLNFFAISDLVFLRCINVCIGLGTLWFGWKTILMLTEKNSTRLLFIVLCTNTLMLTFLNSFVSYDNLVNFLAAALLYFLVAFFEKRSMAYLLSCTIFLLAGCLTKTAFLPFAVLVLVALVFREYQNMGHLVRELGSCFLFKKARQSTLMLVCIVLLVLNLALYGGNLVEFKTITPSTEAVIGLENAMQNRIFARNHIVRQFKAGKLTLADARKMASTQIKHEGDRNGAFALLNKAAQEKLQSNIYRMDRFHYGFVWLDLMLAKTYGIMGHKGMEKTGLALVPYLLIILLTTGVMIRKFSRSDMDGNAAMLLFLTAGYALVLMQLVNYPTYDNSGVIVLALQGRYLFPVLYAAYALMAYYLTSFSSKRLNMFVAIAVAALFIAGEFPWFLNQVTSDWYFTG